MNDLERYVSQGRQGLQEESWRDAIRSFQAALRVDLEHAQAHLGLGIAYWHLGRTDEAIFEYRTVLRLNPRSAEAHFGLGVAYRQQGRLEDAIREYLVALRLNPVYAQAHYNLGVAYCQKDRWDEAISEFQAVLCITPDDAEARFGLGLAYKQLGHIDQAIREYQFSLRFNPEFSRAHYNLAVAYLDKGDMSMAVREAQWARELGYEAARTLLAKLGVGIADEAGAAPAGTAPVGETPGSGSSAATAPTQTAETEPAVVESEPEDEEQLSEHLRGRLRWGLVYLSKGKCEHAAALFEDVVGSSPESVKARVALAKAYAGLRRWEDAADALRPLLERHPDHGEAHFLLGQALAAVDRLDDAIDEVELALSLGYEPADKYRAVLREYQAEKDSPEDVSPDGDASPGGDGAPLEAGAEKVPVEGVGSVPASISMSERDAQIAAAGRELIPHALDAADGSSVDRPVGSLEAEPTGKDRESAERQREPGGQPVERVTGGTADLAARAHYERGQAFAQSERWEDALREFQAALEQDEGFSDAYVATGKVYVKLNRWGDAVTAFLASIADRPPDGRSHYYLGLVYAGQGRIDEAASEAARAVQLGYGPAGELYQTLRPDGCVETEGLELVTMMPDKEPSAVLLVSDRADISSPEIGEIELALDAGEGAGEAGAGDVQCHFERGVEFVGADRWDDAIAEFQAALRVDPLLARARLELGRVYARQKNWDAAIQQFRIVVDANPDDGRAYFYMALAFAESGAFDKAVYEAERALRLGHESARSLLERLRQLPGMADAMRDRRQTAGSISADGDGVTLKGGPGQEHFQRGLAAAAQARWSDAVTEFEAALEEMPGFVPARIELGRAHARQRRWDAAAACFGEVLGINPNDADAHFYLGMVHAEKGEWDRATRQFQNALRINPNHAEARKGMGLAYGQKILLAE